LLSIYEYLFIRRFLKAVNEFTNAEGLRVSTTRTAFVLALAIPLLAGCNKDADKKVASDKPDATQYQVTLSSADVEHLGIATAPVQAAEYVPDVRGYGAVANFDTLAQSISDVTTAEASAEQSRAALVHARSLAADKLITRDTLQIAERQAATDNAQVLLARRKQAVTFGRNAPWRSKGESDAIFAKLASGHAVLVHVTFPSSVPSQKVPKTLTVQRVQKAPGGQSWNAAEMWEAPADPAVPGWSFFALVENTDLAEGERVLALMPVGKPVAGELIPGNAVLLSGSNAWCYTQTKPGVYVRHALDISRPMDGGYFEVDGFKAGQAIVVQGGSLLLAHELNPSSGDKD
jgi:hypothetical protein